jgi:hypothetical protein
LFSCLFNYYGGYIQQRSRGTLPRGYILIYLFYECHNSILSKDKTFCIFSTPENVVHPFSWRMFQPSGRIKQTHSSGYATVSIGDMSGRDARICGDGWALEALLLKGVSSYVEE